jgi:uncharacterized membrane protein
MNLPASRLQRILDEAPVEFRLGDYISRGLKFMNENFGLLLAFMLLSSVISFFFQIIPIVGIIASILITPVLQIGYAQFSYAAIKERRVEFGEFFKGFNKIGPLLATYLLTGVIGILGVLPGLILWYQAGMVEWVMGIFEEYPYVEELPDLFATVDFTLFWFGFMLMMIGVLVISTLFAWSLNIVWFYEVGPLEALNASRKLIARNWLSFIGFIIIAGLVAASGILLCGVGILYTAPAMACAQFFAFADSVKLFEGDEEQIDITDHFIA